MSGSSSIPCLYSRSADNVFCNNSGRLRSARLTTTHPNSFCAVDRNQPKRLENSARLASVCHISTCGVFVFRLDFCHLYFSCRLLYNLPLLSALSYSTQILSTLYFQPISPREFQLTSRVSSVISCVDSLSKVD